jgi:hypothetical protein
MDLPMRTLQRHADSGIVTPKDLALAHSLEMRGRQNMKAFEALYRTPEQMPCVTHRAWALARLGVLQYVRVILF